MSKVFTDPAVTEDKEGMVRMRNAAVYGSKATMTEHSYDAAKRETLSDDVVYVYKDTESGRLFVRKGAAETVTKSSSPDDSASFDAKGKELRSPVRCGERAAIDFLHRFFNERRRDERGTFVCTANAETSKIGFLSREINMSCDKIVTVTASDFGLSSIAGLVAMARKTTFCGGSGVLVTRRNSDINWNIICGKDDCHGFYAIAWGN